MAVRFISSYFLLPTDRVGNIDSESFTNLSSFALVIVFLLFFFLKISSYDCLYFIYVQTEGLQKHT